MQRNHSFSDCESAIKNKGIESDRACRGSSVRLGGMGKILNNEKNSVSEKPGSRGSQEKPGNRGNRKYKNLELWWDSHF